MSIVLSEYVSPTEYNVEPCVVESLSPVNKTLNITLEPGVPYSINFETFVQQPACNYHSVDYEIVGLTDLVELK